MTYGNRRWLAGEDPDDRHAHRVTLIHGGHIGSQGEGGGRFSSHCDRCLGCGHFRLGETVVSHADRTLWMNETNFILVDWNIMNERGRETEREGQRRCRDRNRERLCNLQRKQRQKQREGGSERETDYATYRGSKDRNTETDRERDYVTYRGSQERNRERGIMPLTEEAETERERERICNLTTNYNRLGYPPCQQTHFCGRSWT